MVTPYTLRVDNGEKISLRTSHPNLVRINTAFAELTSEQNLAASIGVARLDQQPAGLGASPWKNSG